MTSKRKSFVLHKDSLDILPDLTDEQAGKLFKAIHSYQIGDDLTLDQITKMVFLPFKNQFIRDDEKYQETCERRAIAGSKGGKQKVANASNCKQTVANVADSVSKSDSKSKSVSDSKEIYQQLADAYNASFHDLPNVAKVSQKRKAHINAVIKEFKVSHGLDNLENWINLFNYIRESDFLMGRSSDWRCDFDFIINKNNLLKIIEGKYENANRA